MISHRFKNVVMTTFNQDFQKEKHFLIDESNLDEKESTAVAKRFCNQNKMRFIKITLHAPYEINTWQHNSIYGFDTECNTGCPFYR